MTYDRDTAMSDSLLQGYMDLVKQQEIEIEHLKRDRETALGQIRYLLKEQEAKHDEVERLERALAKANEIMTIAANQSRGKLVITIKLALEHLDAGSYSTAAHVLRSATTP